MTHELKAWPGSFEAIRTNEKKHEVRVFDRPFSVGDTVIFREFIPDITESGPVVKDGKIQGVYTNANLARKITYISQPGTQGLPEGLGVFSIAPV